MNKKILDVKVISTIISIIVFIITIIAIICYKVTPCDKWVFNNVSINLRSSEMTSIMNIITIFGSFLFIIFLMILLLIVYKNKKIIYYLFINTISIYLINDFLKFLVHRSRPVDALVKENGYSFPSSHAMLSTVFYGLLIYLVYKNISNKVVKYPLIVFLSILIILICISRLYLGVHYFTDVVGGIALSVIYIMLFLILNKNFEKRR